MKNIESVLNEARSFSPSESFRSNARINTLDEFNRLYRQSLENPETFWRGVTQELHWAQDWNILSRWKEPHAEWFIDGKINAATNCVDRHVEIGKGEKLAIIFEGEDGRQRKISYAELSEEVSKFANVLKNKGITHGDRVAIYMPLVPEGMISMLACAKIGAIHSVVFGGFSANALSERINDAKAKAVITADGGFRRGQIVPLKATVDEATQNTPSVESVIVWKNLGNPVNMKSKRDEWAQDLMESASNECKPEPVESEHPLFILYTSGSTGKPKGVLHTTAGYLAQCYLTTKTVFDLQENDLYWCTADIGWVTGHSYVVYGPLANGATIFLYEGAPDFPQQDRFWDMIERHKITILYTAPTAIRAFMKWGDEHPQAHDLSSLRLLGSVGEPINPEAWMWYRKVIGQEKCPIVDTWWQTETGGIMITTLPGVHAAKPGSAGLPMFGVEPAIVDHAGKELPRGQGGLLVMKRPWPGMLRTIYGDDERFKKQYFSDIPHAYFAGDGAKQDSQGYYWIMGRVDDVINVSGHRLGTMEIESALVSHDAVAEAAVVGKPDDLRGESVFAFVTLEKGKAASDELKEDLKRHVAKEIGALAKPSVIQFTDSLPKTRSGKIMRRLLRSIASGEKVTSDTSTLEDQGILERLRNAGEEE